MSREIIATVTNDLNQDQRMHRICSTLTDLGFEVTLLGRRRNVSTALLSMPFTQKRLHCFFNKGILFYLEFNFRLLLFLIRKRPHIIWSVDLDTLWSTGLYKRLRKKTKHIHDAHEFFVEVPELRGKNFKRKAWDILGKWMIPNSDLCITVNNELSFILGQRYKNSFSVLRNVPIKSFLDSKKSGPKYLLYQGVLNRGRGLEQVIKTVCQMQENVQLRIAGEGDLSDELRKLKDKIDDDNRVSFLGWLSPDDLKAQTQNAYIGLNLLDSKSLNYKYSLANKFFDYMHSEVPAIHMAFPVYKRICDEYKVGLCIDDLTIHSVESAILQMWNNPIQHAAMQEACKEAKNIYNWENESLNLKEMMDGLYQ